VASDRVLASLAPGPGMASAAAVSYIESVAQRLFQGSPMKRTVIQAEGEPGAAGNGPDDTAEVLGLKPAWLVLLALGDYGAARCSRPLKSLQ
jgi:hypothetical protein